MASDRHDASGRRFTVATTKKYRAAQKQLDLFKDAPTRPEPHGADRKEEGKAVLDQGGA